MVKETSIDDERRPWHPLPFDVEVHQLPSGQRMVLDSHRLLIPDVGWIDWMRENDEAKPRVWAVRMHTPSSHVDVSSVKFEGVSTGRLDLVDVVGWPGTSDVLRQCVCSSTM